jgi:hypothetical protein
MGNIRASPLSVIWKKKKKRKNIEEKMAEHKHAQTRIMRVDSETPTSIIHIK